MRGVLKSRGFTEMKKKHMFSEMEIFTLESGLEMIETAMESKSG